MCRITSVQVKENYTLSLEFDDGTIGDICVADRLFGPMFEPLKDPAFFAQVATDQYGAICWPNNADMAPDALHEKISKSNLRASRSDRLG